jgi:hypothetical protein
LSQNPCAVQGYGTDQALLTFERWGDELSLSLVVLMFSENDVADNNSEVRYRKPKPKFEILDDQLVLTGVPVPKEEAWAREPDSEMTPEMWEPDIWKKNVLLHSHFLHDIFFRLDRLPSSRKKRRKANTERESKPKQEPKIKDRHSDLTLTSRILVELREDVESRGAKLIVVFIPSKREIEKLSDSEPYQIGVAELCQELGIEHLDLASGFKSTWFRTYFRKGGHWNPHGHKVAAKALGEYLGEYLTNEMTR